jgi:tRNA (guanine-N7-)-methyltransferase
MPRRKAFKYEQVKEFENVFDGFEILEQKLNYSWLNNTYDQNKPLILELGCGYGEYTTSLAGKLSDKNFIGVDIKGDRLWKGAKFALDNNLQNVAFLRSDIKKIAELFGPKSVSEIWVTFPDPQPNKPRKRLIYKDFLDIYSKLLKAEGKIFLKTDNKEFFEFALEQIQLQKAFKLISSTFDLYNSDLMDKSFGVQTRYEKKFGDLGFKICFLEAEQTTF